MFISVLRRAERTANNALNCACINEIFSAPAFAHCVCAMRLRIVAGVHNDSGGFLGAARLPTEAAGLFTKLAEISRIIKCRVVQTKATASFFCGTILT